MSSGEEIDYSKFIGKFYRDVDEVESEKQILEGRKKRQEEDEISARRYKERKETLRHKYSPIRHGMSKEEKSEFIEKTQK